MDNQDAEVFLHYLKLYLSPLEEIKHDVLFGNVKPKFLRLNLSQEVDLLSFSLMPNHFHLQLRQSSIDGVSKLLKRLTTGYVMYFNNRYKRVGPLFQGIYKACPTERDEYLLHLSRYIHLNPRKLKHEIDFNSFSSYSYYLGEKHASWVKPEFVLSYFNNNKNYAKLSYKDFVEDYAQASEELLGENTLEEDCLESG